jgi:putative ABC transport system permease protein
MTETQPKLGGKTMYLITNAIKNLARNKGRNILIAAVTLAIIIGTVVTLTINNAAAKVIDEIRLELGTKVTIEQDIIEMYRMGMDLEANIQSVPISDYYKFADSEYLSKSIFNAEIFNLTSETLTRVQVTDPITGLSGNINMRLNGTSEPDGLIDTFNIVFTEGGMFDGANECIIDDELAGINNVSIGDTINIGLRDSDKPFQLTVTGIYSIDLYKTGSLRFTEIYTSFDTFAAAGWESNQGLSMSVEHFLKDPDYLSLFEQEVRAKGLPDTYNVSINQAAYDRVSGPMASMNSAVATFMIVVLILGAVVLALISFLAVRERKYEVGVLRAMGMERGKVALGIFMEAVMITAICLVIGLGAGSAAAQPIANGLLESRVAAAQAESEERGDDRYVQAVAFGGQLQTVSSVGYVPESAITVALSADVIMQLIIITLCLAAMSGIIGVVIITQYEPLKILRERN